VIKLKLSIVPIKIVLLRLRKMPVKKLLNLFYINFFGLLITFVILLVKPFKRIVLVQIRYTAIGQQATNTGLFLRRLQLENRENKNKIFYIGIAGKPADNNQLIKMFQRKLFIIQNNFLTKICGNGAFIIRWLGIFKNLEFNNNEYYEFNNTVPDLQFTSEEEECGKKLLRDMGIKDNSWFVCFHCRDSAYPKSYEEDWRNSDINYYLDAAEYITSCGGYAIRMGHMVAKKIPELNNPRIIDYASKYRTDFGDIYLSAKCKFFLGSTAGLIGVPAIFNVPIASANFIPFITTWRNGDLFIPKKIWSVEENRFLTFKEFINFAKDVREGDTRLGVDIYTTKKLADGKFRVIENTPQEILELTIEMNERINGTFTISEEDEELQKQFHALIPPDHDYYGTPVRIGTKFLRDNRNLLS